MSLYARIYNNTMSNNNCKKKIQNFFSRKILGDDVSKKRVSAWEVSSHKILSSRSNMYDQEYKASQPLAMRVHVEASSSKRRGDVIQR